MLRLAVATRAQTYQRMGDPLAERGIEAVHLETTERPIDLAASPGEFDVGFVFPPRIAEGGVIDALLDIPWVNDREQVLRSRHKGEALARLRRAGLPVPETVVISNPVDQATLSDTYDQFDGPVVVKPNATTRGIGVARAGDLDTFLGICDYVGLLHEYPATGDRSFLVQSFLPDAVDYRVMVVDGEYAGAVRRAVPNAGSQSSNGDEVGEKRWKHNVHRGGTATAVDLDENLRRLAEDTAAALGIPWLGVDLLVTDERAVVTETNARPTIDDASKYEAGFWDDVATLVTDQAPS